MLKQIALLAMLLFFGSPSAWAVGSRANSGVEGGQCLVDENPTSQAYAHCALAGSTLFYYDSNGVPHVYADSGNTNGLTQVQYTDSAAARVTLLSSGWQGCSKWTSAGTILDGVSSHCWDFTFDANAGHGITLADANALVNTAEYSFAGKGANYLNTYEDTLFGYQGGSSNTLFDAVDGIKTQNVVGGPMMNHLSITFNQSISGAFALALGAGGHEGMFFDGDGASMGDTLYISYRDFGDYNPSPNWTDITRAAIFSVNQAFVPQVEPQGGSNVPEPESLLLVAAGLLCLGLIRKK